MRLNPHSIYCEAEHTARHLTVGGIISTWSFLAKDAPNYIPGYSVCIVFLGISLAACCVYLAGITLENRRRDRLRSSEVDLSAESKEIIDDLDLKYRYMK